MRHIYYIGFTIIVLSALLAFGVTMERGPQGENAALVINDRVITTDEFNGLYASCPPSLKENGEFTDYLITKELMIQESQKEGIDREESFRRSIQNFYEQSLIKLLMDKKYASLDAAVGEEELDGYTAFMGRRLHLTLFNYGSREDAEKGANAKREEKTVNFKELSAEMRHGIIPLKDGGMTPPVKLGGGYVVIRLDGADELKAPRPSAEQREEIRNMLMAEKRQIKMNDWIEGLRKHASIKVFIDAGKREGADE
jgi:hypothetical protein